jgi:hypothetical protein
MVDEYCELIQPQLANDNKKKAHGQVNEEMNKWGNEEMGESGER